MRGGKFLKKNLNIKLLSIYFKFYRIFFLKQIQQVVIRLFSVVFFLFFINFRVSFRKYSYLNLLFKKNMKNTNYTPLEPILNLKPWVKYSNITKYIQFQKFNKIKTHQQNFLPTIGSGQRFKIIFKKLSVFCILSYKL